MEQYYWKTRGEALDNILSIVDIELPKDRYPDLSGPFRIRGMTIFLFFNKPVMKLEEAVDIALKSVSKYDPRPGWGMTAAIDAKEQYLMDIGYYDYPKVGKVYSVRFRHWLEDLNGFIIRYFK